MPITIKEKDLDLGSFKNIKEIIIGKNCDGYGSDIFILYTDGSEEGFGHGEKDLLLDNNSLITIAEQVGYIEGITENVENLGNVSEAIGLIKKELKIDL